ncbi:MAG: phosphate transport system regulatory protein PhoU [Planctomycetota bacterium]|nr:MAG: phosphate transport system regulatory protein PhoU [Planctomycetota bacterium]
MTKHLLRDLDQLSSDLLRLTYAVEDALTQALNCLMARDVEGARAVVRGDVQIDEMEVQLEEDALKVLALHQPVAGDLRFIVAAIKINNDLERIADHAAKLAKRAIELADLTPVQPPARFEEMADKVRAMVRAAIQALIKRDPDKARVVLLHDDEVDALHLELVTRLRKNILSGEPESVDPLLRWVTSVRGLERVADLATNIAEDVLYMIEGEIVRHRDLDLVLDPERSA